MSAEIHPDLKPQQRSSTTSSQNVASGRTDKPSPSNASPVCWTTSSIYSLISAYKYLVNQQEKGQICVDPAALWTEISKKLQVKKFYFTPEQCRTKWSMLKKLYFLIQTQKHIEKFEFFRPLHTLFKNERIQQILSTKKRKNGNEVKSTGQQPPKKQVKKENSDILNPTENESAYEYVSIEIDTDKDNANSHKEDNTDNNVQLNEYVEIETLEPAEEDVPVVEDKSYDHPFVPSGMLSPEELPGYIQSFREVVEMQERKRDERHHQKMQMFRDLNERLLAQQEEAIQQHKSLIQEIINKL